MKLVETTISHDSVRMRWADDPNDPTEWADICFRYSNLKHESETALPSPERLQLAAIQAATLRRLRALVDGEIRRLPVNPPDHNP